MKTEKERKRERERRGRGGEEERVDSPLSEQPCRRRWRGGEEALSEKQTHTHTHTHTHTIKRKSEHWRATEEKDQNTHQLCCQDSTVTSFDHFSLFEQTLCVCVFEDSESIKKNNFLHIQLSRHFCFKGFNYEPIYWHLLGCPCVNRLSII